MKLDKFTRICINIVLILVIVLLLKLLITVPKDVYAARATEYMAEGEIGKMDTDEFTDMCNEYAKEGWKLHSFSIYVAMFER